MTIHLRLQSEQDHQAVIQKLRSLYGLRLDVRSVDERSIAISFNKRTFSEWFAETFVPGQAAEARYKAAMALNEVFRMTSGRMQLDQQGDDAWMPGVDILSDTLVSQIAAIASKVPKLAGARSHAHRRGDSLNFLRAPAVEVVCDYAILGSDTARRELVRLHRQRASGQPAAGAASHELLQLEKQLDELNGPFKTLVAGAAAKRWICIRDFAVPNAGGAFSALPAAEIMRCISLAAASAATGAVVIEPFADRYVPKHGQLVRSFSDQALRAQLEAAHEAMMRNRHLVVSFACNDDELLQRLQRLASPGLPANCSGMTRSACAREAPSRPGIHYLLNDPLRLNAERIIMPASMLKHTRFRAIPERELPESPGEPFDPATGVQLVAMEDTAEHGQGIHGSTETSQAIVRSRYDRLLAGVSGRVVIHPPQSSGAELAAMMSAVHAYCKQHPRVAASIVFHGDVANRRADLLSYAMQRTGLISHPHEIQWDAV